MNKNLTYAVIGILVLVGLWFLVFNKPSQPTPQPEPVTEQKQATESATPPAEITVTLSEKNDSGESGIATLMEVDGKVQVTLAISGAPAGVTQPAHIHVGSCPDVGAVKYPLTSPVDGVSETVLDVSLDQLRSELPLGINVHKSATEVKVYVACGDLTL